MTYIITVKYGEETGTITINTDSSMLSDNLRISAANADNFFDLINRLKTLMDVEGWDTVRLKKET